MDAIASHRYPGPSPYDLFPGQAAEVVTYGVPLILAITIGIGNWVTKYINPLPPPPQESHPDHLMYCTKIENISNVTFEMSTVHCNDLPKQQRRETPDVSNPLSFRFCSKILGGSNTTVYGESVPCDSLMSSAAPHIIIPGDPIFESTVLRHYCTRIQQVTNVTFHSMSLLCFNLPKLELKRAALIQMDSDQDANSLFSRYYCSVQSYHKSPEVILSGSTPCVRLKETAYNENEVGLKMSMNGTFFQERDSVELFHYLSLALALTAVLVSIALSCRSDKNADSEDTNLRDWAQIQEETKQKLDAVLRERKEIEERQRKRRAELEAERENRARGMFSALLGSVTQPVVEERKNFNRWLETPD